MTELVPQIAELKSKERESRRSAETALRSLEKANEAAPRLARAKKKEKHLTLSTVHSAKGLEWPVVFVMAAFDGRLPKLNKEGEGDLEEELRVAYVAVTRPQRKLVITYPATIRYYKDTISTRMCRFLEEAQNAHPGIFEFQDKTDPYKDYRDRGQQQYRRRYRW